MALESIALIPSGYKATKVYSQLPVNGNGDFTFDRGTSTDQTRVNKNGLIESVAQDVPRVDYLDGGCPSLLLEPASTNLVTYSEDFSNVAWIKSGGTITSNSVLSPDGSVNADTLVSNALGSTFIEETLTVSSATKYNVSFFVKKSNVDFFSIILLDGAIAVRQYFNINTGVVASVVNTGSPTYENVKIEDYGNGWYRCSLTYTMVGTSLQVRGYIADADSNPSSASGSEVYIFGSQVEQQSYATSYMPSLSGVSGVRNSETCNGAGTTAEINSQEGVLFFEGRAIADSLTFRSMSLSDSTTNNRLIFYYSSTSNRITCDMRVGAVTTMALSFDLINSTEYIKVAVLYKENDFKFYVNGLLVNIDTSGAVPSSSTFSELAFDDGGGGSDFYGRVKKLSVYNDTTQDLEKLTGFTSFAEMSSYLSYS